MIEQLYRAVAFMTLEQLAGDPSSDRIENSPLESKSLQSLANTADLLIQYNNDYQTSLLKSVDTGLLRSTGEYALGEQNNVITESFSALTVRLSADRKFKRSLQEDSFAELTIPSMEFGTKAAVNVTDSLAFEEYDTVILTSFVYRELAQGFGSDYDPIVV